MNGAESLVRTLLAGGVDTCFANPGTSEMHFVAALDRAPGMHCVLALFEGVVTGAADGYARIAGKPAATLLHCGPGLANGLANLHNARRARVPMVNIAGDQATYHTPLDPLLAADTEGWARSISVFLCKVKETPALGAQAARAIEAANLPPGGIATLILPSDVSWGEGGVPGAPKPAPAPGRVSDAAIEDIARVLRRREPTLLLLGGAGLSAAALADGERIAAATGATLMAPTFNTKIARGRGRPSIPCVPYAVDEAVAQLAGLQHLVLVGARAPVAFFAYPGKPGLLAPDDAAIHMLARPEEDQADGLARLADALRAPRVRAQTIAPPSLPGGGAMSAEAAAQTLAALMPENAILSDESITLRGPFFAGTAHAAPHDWLQLTGGAIGDGLPVATGAAVAARARRVIALQADGSAMYTVQALWTQAREALDVTTIILSNRQYAILFKELAQVGAQAGRTAHDMFALERPDLGWVSLANGMGVEAARADTLECFADLLRHSFARRGPFLIELMIGSP
jgi:acetolactate synthase-1/2/3 large subunit